MNSVKEQRREGKTVIESERDGVENGNEKMKEGDREREYEEQGDGLAEWRNKRRREEHLMRGKRDGKGK